MKFGVLKFEELGKSGLKFECFGGWDDFKTLAIVIEKNIKAERIRNINGVWTRVCWYKKNNLIFELHHNDDIGNYIDITDVGWFKSLDLIEDDERALEIIGNNYIEDSVEAHQLLNDIALETANILSKKITPTSKSIQIDQYISLEKRGKKPIILIDGKCTEIELLDSDKKDFDTLCSEIKEWIKSDYLIELDPNYLKWQLLQRLVGLGAPNSKEAFQQHIALRYMNADNSYKRFLKKNGYLDNFTPEELNELEKLRNSKNQKAKKPKYEEEDLHIIFLGEALLVKSGILDLSYLPIGDLNKVENLKNLKDLRILSLRGSYIKKIPEWIGNFTSLEDLDLAKVYCFGNEFKTLPSSIGSLINLKKLNLSGRDISSLPETIGNLKSLRILNLSNNKLTVLPKTMRNLKELEELNLSFNNIIELPDWLGDLGSLKKLLLFYYKDENIVKLTQSIKDLEKKGIQVLY